MECAAGYGMLHAILGADVDKKPREASGSFYLQTEEFSFRAASHSTHSTTATAMLSDSLRYTQFREWDPEKEYKKTKLHIKQTDPVSVRTVCDSEVTSSGALSSGEGFVFSNETTRPVDLYRQQHAAVACTTPIMLNPEPVDDGVSFHSMSDEDDTYIASGTHHGWATYTPGEIGEDDPSILTGIIPSLPLICVISDQDPVPEHTPELFNGHPSPPSASTAPDRVCPDGLSEPPHTSSVSAAKGTTHLPNEGSSPDDAIPRECCEHCMRSNGVHQHTFIQQDIKDLQESVSSRLDHLAKSVAACFQIMISSSTSGASASSAALDEPPQGRRKRKRQQSPDEGGIPDNNDEQEWAVEKIITHRDIRGRGKGRRLKRQYLCQWQHTWMDESACEDLAALDEYERRLSTASK
ncbi:hypothetical protein NA57DRAFT_52755 [Rhizodiscina lignyota]|uniref:Chromo domain-containing protein n=1 Tax=Rhizodiscina lignyota TaxID=1504668 RepID=A0A9P4IL98_9PEZI|nr:hypothetical protein NA57DRAFT_52755 [Rhizodiscina lignyota]